MASRYWHQHLLASLLFLLCVGLSSLQDSNSDVFEKENIELLATGLSRDLKSFFTSTVPYDSVKNKYETSNRVTYKPVDGRELVQNMASELGEFLGKKVAALKRIVERAEKIAQQYTWDGTLKNAKPVSGENWFSDEEEIGTVEYVNAKLLKRHDPMLEYNPMFKQSVNMSVSSVHIPVEIYEGNIDILNGLKWTAALDTLFEENRKNDSDLLWQFFGSQNGFMRTFPASRWRCNGEVDLYDVRRRPWYTQGSSSPKDMLILIDASGSVHGQALQLIKVAVQSLLDTLGDNDFFNIIKFSTEASFVHDCFNHTFVQANYRNKRILQDKVGELKAKGKADFRAGLTFAFEQFIRFNKTSMMNHGANCNKVIMLLTDGGSDKAKEVFEKYNWPNNKSVRVFTYTIGSTSDPTDSIHWMACANRGIFNTIGFYSPIPAMGAIRSKVQDYVKVLSRPLALGQPSDVMWTSVYKDTLGLGMLTTVTLPVYNRSAVSTNQTILGVMGLDVTTERLMEAAPLRKLTPNGYAFAINQNGYIIFHPELKAQYGWLQDPPNVDFLDLEYETEKKDEVRTKMIDRLEGQALVQTFLVQSDQKHIVEVNRTYYFTKIDHSDFSVAIVIPDYAQVYPEVESTYTREEGFKLLENDNTTILMPSRKYYKENSVKNSSKETGTAQDLIDIKSTAVFEEDLLQLLFWDAEMTQDIGDFFRLVKEQLNETWEGVLAIFIGTSSGLTRVHPECATKEFLDVRDTWEASYYKRALETDQYLFMAPPNGRIEGNDTIVPAVTMVKAITIPAAGKIYKPAVFGVKMEHSKMLGFMAAQNLGSANCNDSDDVVCYLLDDGGFVIATNQIEKYAQVGHFFGTVDNPLMQQLLNDSDKPDAPFYYRKVRYDYQASCPDQPGKSSIAGLPSLRIPTLSMFVEMLSVNWWSSQLTWAYINFNLYNWLFGPSSVYGQDGVAPYTISDQEESEEEEDADCTPIDEDQPTNHSCTKYEAQYYFIPGKIQANGVQLCENCTRTFYAHRVPETNLLLVVADPVCDECIFEDILQAPREDEDPDDCLLNMRYRERPDGCYSEDDNEDDTECGGMSYLPSSWLIITLTLITVFTIRQST